MKTISTWLMLAIPLIAANPPISAITMSPDGKQVLSASQSGIELRVWPELRAIESIPTQLENIHALSFSPDGKFLVVGGGTPGEHGSIELRSWPEKKLRYRAKLHSDLVMNISWTPDSRQLALASTDRTVRLVDVETGRCQHIFEGHSRAVLSVVIMPPGDRLVSASVDGSLRVWNLKEMTLERELSQHTKAVLGLAVQPDAEAPLLASIGDDRTVRFWQPATGRMLRFARLNSEPRALVWPQARNALMVACRDGSVQEIDPDSVEVKQLRPAHEDGAYSIAIAPNGTLLVGGSQGRLTQVPLR